MSEKKADTREIPLTAEQREIWQQADRALAQAKMQLDIVYSVILAGQGLKEAKLVEVRPDALVIEAP